MNFTLGIDKNLESMLRELAGKLGVTVEELWKSGISYTYATGIADLATAAILIIGVFLLGFLSYRWRDNEAASTVSFLGAVAASVPILPFLRDGIRAVMAPDGTLLINILQMITRTTK